MPAAAGVPQDARAPASRRRRTTVTGSTLGENIDGAKVFNEEVIRPLDKPISKGGGTAVLRGNLAPDGCVIKPTAAEPRLLKHAGPALVFRDYNDMSGADRRDDLDVTPDHVLVLQNAGPVGGPGMPEWGMLPIPKKLLKEGVRDMVRISDARMSGTSYGACILHVAPEAYVGGPLAAVRNGDIISVDVRGADDRARDLGRASWRAGSRPDVPQQRPEQRGYVSSTPPTSRRPTRAATMISWKGRSPSRSRKFTEARGAPACLSCLPLTFRPPSVIPDMTRDQGAHARPAWVPALRCAPAG